MINKENFNNIDLMQFGHTIQLNGAIFSDSKTTYLLCLPDEYLEMKIAIVHMSHEQWKVLLRQTDLQETKVLSNDQGKIKKAIMRKSARQIDSKVSWNVYRRDNYTCRYCGKNDVPLTIDHLILWEDGGPTIEDNLLSSCRKCNQTRGNMKYLDWLRSEYYSKVSQNLPHEIRVENDYIEGTLKDIPIKLHIPNRNKKKKKR